MSEESKVVEPPETLPEQSNQQIASVESDDEDQDGPEDAQDTAAATTSKKKKSKRKRIKSALTGKTQPATSTSTSTSTSTMTPAEQFSKAIGGMSNDQVATLLSMNPALAQQIGAGEGSDLSGKDAVAALKKLNLEDVMTGLAATGKNVKDMASYKFWQTQPVPKFGDNEIVEEGPFKMIDPATVDKNPGPLVEGFEWVTMDMTDAGEVKEVFELLSGHYVEDEEAMFRFNYSESFLKWYACMHAQEPVNTDQIGPCYHLDGARNGMWESGPAYRANSSHSYPPSPWICACVKSP